MGLTLWQVKIDGRIALLWLQDMIDKESLFPGTVGVTHPVAVRCAPGRCRAGHGFSSAEQASPGVGGSSREGARGGQAHWIRPEP